MKLQAEREDRQCSFHSWYSCMLSPLSGLYSASREMKRGNIGLALGLVGKQLRSSFGASVDLGLTGQDGVVHPSLAVRMLKCSAS